MKSFVVKECRNCNTKYLQEDKAITLSPGEELDIVILTTAKCSQCKMKQVRSISGPKVPFTGK